MFDQIFFSPQLKPSEINTHGIYKLPHELANDLKLRILGDQEISRKFQNFKEL